MLLGCIEAESHSKEEKNPKAFKLSQMFRVILIVFLILFLLVISIYRKVYLLERREVRREEVRVRLSVHWQALPDK